MNSKDSSHQNPDPSVHSASGFEGDLSNCCIQTITKHVQYNPMMVCDQCKQIIKCFQEENKYKNYLTFCQSRRRKVKTGQTQGYYTIVFKSYDTYG